MLFQPMPLSRRAEAFNHPDWLFEIKWDGFRALLYSENDGVRLMSRNGNAFKSFPNLCEGLSRDLNGRRCVLDGEIVCLDRDGKPQFRDLLFRRTEPVFYAFDILWDEQAKSDDEVETRRFRNGEDTRYLPLIDRKLRLRRVVPKQGERLLYCDYIETRQGREELFEKERTEPLSFQCYDWPLDHDFVLGASPTPLSPGEKNSFLTISKRQTDK